MKKLIMVSLIMIMVIVATKCKTNEGDSNGNGSFANIVDVWDGFAGAEGGAIPIVSLVVLNYRNESNKSEIATVKVDWPNGTSSSKNIQVPSTPPDLPDGMAITEEFDCDIWCPQAFIFKGEMSITVQVHVEFQGYISPIFDKVITMKNFGH